MKMKFLRFLIKAMFTFCLIMCSLIFTAFYGVSRDILPSYKINRGQTLELDTRIPVTAVVNGTKMSKQSAENAGDSLQVDLKIFGLIPFSTVNVEVVDPMYVSVLGNPFGMKIYTEGVLVIETGEVDNGNGTVEPAKLANIKVGDYIKSVNGTPISCNEDLSEFVINSGGKALNLQVVRDGKTFNTKIAPVLSIEGMYRVGIWVRDSSAGIGTLTFYSPSTNVVCGLGHGICDSDTNSLLSIHSGELVAAQIVSVEKGSAGAPGELKGKFTYHTIADIALNTDMGVYGNLYGEIDTANLTEIALRQDVKEGNAQILCTVEGDTPKLYSCTVKKRNSSNNGETQNLIVTVTDPALINATGGIVQGMSGSPLLQNGKLIGAVTHVLVDDPTKGYGIFAENMLETAQSVAEGQQLKDAS